jgi:outer membrane protein assembly factor BamB
VNRPGAPPAPNPSGPARTGDIVAERYRVEAELGRGGMAVVYRATDIRLDRPVALKLLHRYVASLDRHRFSREIRALATLAHPNVITVYDLGESGEDTYLTMELASGGNFADLGPLEDDPGQQDALLDSATRVAEALAYVHGRGMVHRDLTPGNILLTTERVPKVMDFGLVQLAQASRDLTRTGYTLGTPHYMSPEQARGQEVGPASDLYSLGCVLYKTITGRPPFEADNDQSLLYHHVYETPEPPSTWNPAISEELDSIVADLLAKSPTDRPDGAGVVARRLEAARERLRRRSWSAAWRGGSARTGVVPCGPFNPSNLRESWRVTLPDGAVWPAHVAVSGETAIIPTRDGSVTALAVATGDTLWQAVTGDQAGPPIVIGDFVAVGSWDGNAYALDRDNGRALWRTELGAPLAGAPAADRRRLYWATTEGRVAALDHQGQLVWEVDLGAPVAAAPSLAGGLLLVAGEGGGLHLVDPADGRLAARIDTGGCQAGPVWAGRRWLLPEAHGELSLLDLDLAQAEWTYDLEGEIWAPPAVHAQTVYAVSWHGVLRALTLAGGEDLWSLDLGGRITAAPIVSSGLVIAASEEGRLALVPASSGQVAGEYELGFGLQATPGVAAGRIVVAGLDGTALALGEG